MIKLSTILPNPSNPRLIKDDKFEKLCNSIKEFPAMMALRPMVTDVNNVVLGGNMRLKALQHLGYKEVPDEWIKKASDLTAEEQRRFIIADNVGFGEHDWELLRSDWDAQELEDWGVEVPEFVSDEVLTAEEDDYEIPDTIETDIVLGDLFEIGEHRLLCGDSTQVESYEKLMGGELADMSITDPPYNVAYVGKTSDKLTIENDVQTDSNFFQFLLDFYVCNYAYMKNGAVIYVWHASSEIINFAKAMVDAGFLLKQQLIWIKNCIVMGRQDYQWQHEPCLYGWKDGAGHKWYSDRKQSTVLEFNKPTKSTEHPTMKPIPLFSYQINNSSQIGDVILDSFGGSGTTMVCCEQMKRKARVLEVDPKYCQVIIDRMRKLDPKIEIKKL